MALVVGVADYRGIEPLRNTVRDAQLISERLRQVGFEVSTLRDPDAGQLDQALRDFSFQAEVAEIALLYFAGHGVEVGTRNFVLAADAVISRMEDVPAQGFALDRLLAATATARSLRIVILDSCRDNPFSAVAGVDAFAKSASAQVEQSATASARGTLVVYSTKDGAPALDGDGANSPFAFALAETLGQRGIEIGMVFRRVRDAVLQATRGQQEPYTYGSLSGRPLFLAGGGEPDSAGTDRRQAWSAMRPDDEIQLLALADAGDTRSLVGLAYIRQNPGSRTYDPRQAFEYLKRAAQAGNAEAQYELGKAFEKGIGTPQDVQAALHWFNQAADQDFGDAINDLGYLYSFGGGGLPRDRQRGVDLFMRAAELGQPEALFNAAAMIDEGRVEGRGSSEAALYLYRAIRAGSEEVLNQLSTKPDVFSQATRTALQQLLRDNGFYQSAIDGRFGEGTRRGLRRAYGLQE
ncbi:MAG: caspase family protein [Rhizobiaceae bacterium]|nr:caspase family protein [Rhizobiaceae bacterium]